MTDKPWTRWTAEVPLRATIEHTLLAAAATPAMIADLLLVTVVGFPLGASARAAKAFECELAVREGAHEIDMVVDIGALKAADRFAVREDIAAVVQAASGKPVKVILETALLDDGEKRLGCALAEEAGAAYVKTSTGFAGGGATLHDVALMREVVGDRLGIKASGGIRDLDFARALLAAGADRLGTSAGVALAVASDAAK
jgi:deoxyribose-phosphate aldolase